MNDRYLFKAKRIDWKEWVKECQWLQGNLISVGERYYLAQCENNSNELWIGEWVEVDPSTICQCTGLKDKNGTLIWENDLVLTPKEDGYSLICWNDTEARWEMRNETEGIVLDFDNYWSNEIEVCENIFDNPELMEVE